MFTSVSQFTELWKQEMQATHAVFAALMRQSGLRLPSFYGPVREDWAQWGMQPPTI